MIDAKRVTTAYGSVATSCVSMTMNGTLSTLDVYIAIFRRILRRSMNRSSMLLAAALAADDDVLGGKERGDRQPALPQRMSRAHQAGEPVLREPPLTEVSLRERGKVAGRDVDVALLQSPRRAARPAP